MVEIFIDTMHKFMLNTGFAVMTWGQFIMIAIGCLLLYLAIAKGFEPLLLLPIAFGVLISNIPIPNVQSMLFHPDLFVFNANNVDPNFHPEIFRGEYYLNIQEIIQKGGLLDLLYLGVKLGIYPPLIFLGVGAMTDFGPLIANPKSILLGAAAQLGVAVTFLGALVLSALFPDLIHFGYEEASAIGIIGGADGPTAIFVTKELAPHLLPAIAIAAYSYMALVPIIQPPIMKALTTKKERSIVMEQLRPVSKKEKIIFSIVVTIVVSIIVPDAIALVGMLMLGNLARESGVVDRISKTAQNELINIITIFLGLTVGATATAENFLSPTTLGIIVLGLFAFSISTAGGVLFGKLMCKLTNGKVNPLIGSAGVSAVPMAARVSQVVGQKENPGNFLLMHAMGPNVAGVIGSAVAAGVFLALFGK